MLTWTELRMSFRTFLFLPHLRQTPECPLSHHGVGGVEAEEDAAAHDGAVHEADHLEPGREEVEEVLGPVDVDQVEAVTLSDLLVFLTSGQREPPAVSLQLSIINLPRYDVPPHEDVSASRE